MDAQSIFTWLHLRETLYHILATFHSGVRTALVLCLRVCSGTTGGNRQSTGDESGWINAQPPIFQWRVLRRQHSFPESPQKECGKLPTSSIHHPVSNFEIVPSTILNSEHFFSSLCSPFHSSHLLLSTPIKMDVNYENGSEISAIPHFTYWMDISNWLS